MTVAPMKAQADLKAAATVAQLKAQPPAYVNNFSTQQQPNPARYTRYQKKATAKPYYIMTAASMPTPAKVPAKKPTKAY